MDKKEEKKKKNDIEKVSSNNEGGNSQSDELIPDEILEAIPEEDRTRFASIIKQTMISGVMRRSNPIADKINEEHITSLITNSNDQDKRDRAERKGIRNYNLILIFIALAFVVFLVVFLQEREDLLIKIIIGIISFIGGFGFGQSRIVKTE